MSGCVPDALIGSMIAATVLKLIIRSLEVPKGTFTKGERNEVGVTSPH